MKKLFFFFLLERKCGDHSLISLKQQKSFFFFLKLWRSCKGEKRAKYLLKVSKSVEEHGGTEFASVWDVWDDQFLLSQGLTSLASSLKLCYGTLHSPLNSAHVKATLLFVLLLAEDVMSLHCCCRWVYPVVIESPRGLLTDTNEVIPLL